MCLCKFLCFPDEDHKGEKKKLNFAGVVSSNLMFVCFFKLVLSSGISVVSMVLYMNDILMFTFAFLGIL